MNCKNLEILKKSVCFAIDEKIIKTEREIKDLIFDLSYENNIPNSIYFDIQDHILYITKVRQRTHGN